MFSRFLIGGRDHSHTISHTIPIPFPYHSITPPPCGSMWWFQPPEDASLFKDEEGAVRPGRPGRPVHGSGSFHWGRPPGLVTYRATFSSNTIYNMYGLIDLYRYLYYLWISDL